MTVRVEQLRLSVQALLVVAAIVSGLTACVDEEVTSSASLAVAGDGSQTLSVFLGRCSTGDLSFEVEELQDEVRLDVTGSWSASADCAFAGAVERSSPLGDRELVVVPGCSDDSADQPHRRPHLTDGVWVADSVGPPVFEACDGTGTCHRFVLDDAGADVLDELADTFERVALVVDGRVVIAPRINSPGADFDGRVTAPSLVGAELDTLVGRWPGP